MAKKQDASNGKIVDDGNTNTDPDGMHVKVYSPFQTYFDSPALSITAVNETGPFDILPKHHNFITLLNAGDIVIHTAQEKHTIKIARGLMHVKADRVVVFLDV